MRMEPTPARTTVVPAAAVWPLTVKVVTARAEPSTSESLARTLPLAVLFSRITTVSSRLTGASLTARTVSESAPTSVATPSETV